MKGRVGIGLLLLSVLLVGGLPARAQSGGVTVQAALDRTTAAVGEPLTLTVQVSGGSMNLSSPQLPALRDFEVFSAGRSQNMTIDNGQISASMTYTYALTPRRPGKLTIPPITVSVNGQSYATQPLTVTVTRAAASPTPPPGGGPNVLPGFGPPHYVPAPGRKRIRRAPPVPIQKLPPGPIVRHDPIFVTAQVDHPHACVGQQVTYIFRFFRSIELADQPRYAPPDTTGFVTEDLPPQRTYETVVNGRRYLVDEIRTALFPTAPGTFKLGPAQLQVAVSDFLVPPGFDDDSFMRRFFSAGQEQTLSTNPVTVTVTRPPAAGQPADFSGAVGRFHIQAKVDGPTVAAGSPVNVEVTVKGDGNLQLLTAPKLTPPAGFRVYDTVSSLRMVKKHYRVQGTRTFTTMLVPSRPGRFELKDIRFSYYDPDVKRYRTAVAAPVAIAVGPGASGATVAASPAAAPSPVAGDGLAPIHAEASFRHPLHLASSPVFLAAQGIPAVALLGTFGAGWLRRRRDRTAGARRRGSALGRARSRVSALAGGDGLAGLAPALHGYLEDKLGRKTSALSMRELTEALGERGVGAQDCALLKDLLERSDMARYAPSADAAAQNASALDEARGLLKRLEGALR